MAKADLGAALGAAKAQSGAGGKQGMGQGGQQQGALGSMFGGMFPNAAMNKNLPGGGGMQQGMPPPAGGMGPVGPSPQFMQQIQAGAGGHRALNPFRGQGGLQPGMMDQSKLAVMPQEGGLQLDPTKTQAPRLY
jgi:hypothetical protein